MRSNRAQSLQTENERLQKENVAFNTKYYHSDNPRLRKAKNKVAPKLKKQLSTSLVPRTPTLPKDQDSQKYKLLVHGLEFNNGEEIVLNPQVFPEVKQNDILEIKMVDKSHPRLILQVKSMSAIKGKVQISILKDIAAQFGIDAFHDVYVTKQEPGCDVVDFIELAFKDQFLSRADIWRFKIDMFGKALYTSKNLRLLGIRAQVSTMLINGQNVQCGVVGADTKLILRSRSSRIFWLIQMSTEMWEYDDDGEVYYEKLLHRLIQVLFDRWRTTLATHSVTIILFSRSFYAKNQFPKDYQPNSALFNACSYHGHGPGATGTGLNASQGYGPTIHVDSKGQYYEDFYQVVAQDLKCPDWGGLLRQLKRDIVNYIKIHRWRVPENFCPAAYQYRTVDNADDKKQKVVHWLKLPQGVPSKATNGNVLEAINVTLNMLDKHYMDRDLSRTGQNIVMITAGSGVFKVEQKLSQITKQRMMDNGIGMDMISLSTPPLHAVPLFVLPQSDILNDSGRGCYHIPHWISIGFLDLDCPCKNSICQCNHDEFRPLPSFRMFDLAAPDESQMFPSTLRNMLKNISDNEPTPPSNTLGRMKFEMAKSGYDITAKESMISEHEALFQATNVNNFIALPTPPSLERNYLSSALKEIQNDKNVPTYDVLQDYDSKVFCINTELLQRDSRHHRRTSNIKRSLAFEIASGISNSNLASTHAVSFSEAKSSLNSAETKEEMLVVGSASPGTPLVIKSHDSDEIQLSKSFENRRGFMRPPPTSLWTGSTPPKQIDPALILRTSEGPATPTKDDKAAKFQNSPRRKSNPAIRGPILESHQKESFSPPESLTIIKEPTHSTTASSSALLQQPQSQKKLTHNGGSFTGFSGNRIVPRINPFQTLANEWDSSKRLSSNRRRWIHLFPTVLGENKSMHQGLNWASLSNPAVLPLTTDYYPHPNDLHAMYTESFYTLTLSLSDSSSTLSASVPSYRNHSELVTEMVCQRLSQDFQLVATSAGTAIDNRSRIPAGTTKRGPGGESRDYQSIVFHLSMGHRIHQIIYNEELQTIEVKRYVKRFSIVADSKPFEYQYSLWNSKTNSFHPCRQEFLEYASPEYNWNFLDQLLCGYYDDIPENTKFRRIGLCIVPPILDNVADEQSYSTRFLKLIEYLQTRVEKHSKISVRILSTFSNDGEDVDSTIQNYKISISANNALNTDKRQQWIMVNLSNVHKTNECYQFEIKWLACSGSLIDDFLSTVCRKCKQAGLDLHRVPEYTRSSYLMIHPLLTTIYLPLPEACCGPYLLEMLVHRFHFIFDMERIAGSKGLGRGLGIDMQAKNDTLPYRRYRMTVESMVAQKRTRGYRQYMHRTEPVFLRVLYNGIVWIPGYVYDRDGQSSNSSLYDELLMFLDQLVYASNIVQDMVDSMLDKR